MKEERKIYYVYTHTTPFDDVYVGCTTHIKQRWYPESYRTSSIYPYIQTFGWNNISHDIVLETTDKEEAYTLEDELIRKYTTEGRCINKKRSGLISSDKSVYYGIHNTNHKYQVRRNNRLWFRKPENKIYMRVYDYNKNHAPIMTPQEAKQRFLSDGYIPPFIKSSDITRMLNEEQTPLF